MIADGAVLATLEVYEAETELSFSSDSETAQSESTYARAVYVPDAG